MKRSCAWLTLKKKKIVISFKVSPEQYIWESKGGKLLPFPFPLQNGQGVHPDLEGICSATNEGWCQRGGNNHLLIANHRDLDWDWLSLLPRQKERIMKSSVYSSEIPFIQLITEGQEKRHKCSWEPSSCSAETVISGGKISVLWWSYSSPFYSASPAKTTAWAAETCKACGNGLWTRGSSLVSFQGCVIAAFLPFSFKVLLILHVLMEISLARRLQTGPCAHSSPSTYRWALVWWRAETAARGNRPSAEGTWSNVGLGVLWYPKKRRQIQLVACSCFLTWSCSLLTQDERQTSQT